MVMMKDGSSTRACSTKVNEMMGQGKTRMDWRPISRLLVLVRTTTTDFVSVIRLADDKSRIPNEATPQPRPSGIRVPPED